MKRRHKIGLTYEIRGDENSVKVPSANVYISQLPVTPLSLFLFLFNL